MYLFDALYIACYECAGMDKAPKETPQPLTHDVADCLDNIDLGPWNMPIQPPLPQQEEPYIRVAPGLLVRVRL
jgi:hypothetical protein